ncbi:tyrosine-type recombinase/integrase [Phocaeicola coprocola]|uniref:tyrosine-type recombinase/integrase n=1 Tax=Phocaeicola coprocola TaxID=310298 RepID=UPI0031FE23FB
MSFHTARHTAVTFLLYYNLPLTTVQYILGHTSIRTTEIYTEVNEATIRNSLRVLHIWHEQLQVLLSFSVVQGLIQTDLIQQKP